MLALLGAAAVAVGAAALVSLLHEATHLAAARATGPVAVGLRSWLPFRVRVRYRSRPSPLGLRVVALAPALVGAALAALALATGAWDRLAGVEPYYARHVAAIYWLLYAHVSPADLREALDPARPGDAAGPAAGD